MKINGVDQSKLVKLYSIQKQSIEKTEAVKKSDRVQASSSIQISSLGKSLSTYSPEASLVNSREKVESIKKEISNGTYQRDAKLVAAKVLDEMGI